MDHVVVKILLLQWMAGGANALGGGPVCDALGKVLRKHVPDRLVEVPPHSLGIGIGPLIQRGQKRKQGVAMVQLEPRRQVCAPG